MRRVMMEHLQAEDSVLAGEEYVLSVVAALGNVMRDARNCEVRIGEACWIVARNGTLKEMSSPLAQARSWMKNALAKIRGRHYLPEEPPGETRPPWVAYPGHSPGDGFWRQGEGEAWFFYVWKPFWNSLSTGQQQDYLKRWDVPKIWLDYHFNPEFQKWLEHVDDDIEPGTS